MRAVGDRMIIAPPLVITRAQIDEMVALIRRCLDLTLADAQPPGWLADACKPGVASRDAPEPGRMTVLQATRLPPARTP
jgi:hypothetical protein